MRHKCRYGGSNNSLIGSFNIIICKSLTFVWGVVEEFPTFNYTGCFQVLVEHKFPTRVAGLSHLPSATGWVSLGRPACSARTLTTGDMAAGPRPMMDQRSAAVYK